MLTAQHVIPKSDFKKQVDGYITLAEEDRYRRRLALVSDQGVSFLLCLSQAMRLNHGDGLLLEDGRIIEVIAETEDLYEVRAQTPLKLLELAWHLGNRHQPIEVYKDHLRIRHDPVIGEMLVHLQAELCVIKDHFSPLQGAYHAH